MNHCNFANEEPVPISSSQQDPGQSSSQVKEDSSSFLKLPLRQQAKDEEEIRDNEISSLYHKALIQDIVNGNKTEPTVGRQTLGSLPPTSVSASPVIVSSKNKNKSLNEAFREYQALSNNDQENEESSQKISNPLDEFGNKFVRTLSKIVDRGKHRTKGIIVDPKKGETKSSITGERSHAGSEGSSKPHTSSTCQTEKTQEHPNDDDDEHNNIMKAIIKDFSPEGDQKILRAIQRTVAVNAAVLATTLTGGVAGAGAAGLLTGGAMTAKRLGDGVQQEDEREVAKSLAVYGSATTASFVGQVATGALLVGVAGAALPVAGAVAFGVGCVSGITAGALSEWGVEHALREQQHGDQDGDDNDDDDKEGDTDDETVDGFSEEGDTA